MSTVTIDQSINNTGNVRYIRIGTGGIQINANIATAGDALQFDGNVTLGAGSTITLASGSAAGSTLTLAGTLAGGGSSLAVTGNAVINGAVSGVANLSVSGTTTINTPSITTSGGQTYTGAVTLTQDVTLGSSGSGAITFSGAVDGPRSLTVNTTGITTFSAAVGGVTSLTSLTTDTGGTVSLQSVTTTGVQSYGEDATLNGNYATADSLFSVAGATTLSTDATVSTGSGAITFSSYVDGAFNLTANSTGATTFGGVVGGSTPLTSLTTNAGGTVSLQSVTTTGAQQYGEAAT
ncbi:MAG: hypothetical protein WCQ77_14035, partial [Planctomycetota bacterium]